MPDFTHKRTNPFDHATSDVREKPEEDLVSFYDHLISNLFKDEKKRYLNMGYWTETTSSLSEAGDALVALVADSAGLDTRTNPSPKTHRVLEVGCGMGESSFYLAQNYACDILAIDLNPKHINHARHRLATERPELAEWITFHQASATSLTETVDREFFDMVISIESALHYRTRDRFFKEAFQALKPNGVLVLADVTIRPCPELIITESIQKLILSFFEIPSQNLYGRDQYCAFLEEAGFSDIGIQSIGDRVNVPYFRYYASCCRNQMPTANVSIDQQLMVACSRAGTKYREFLLQKFLPFQIMDMLYANPWSASIILDYLAQYAWDYSIFTARKPS
ncbi:MAG: methyltransferase domain-containing protein [Acidobacteriota bacterium]|nr:methyltransferase domain-containing protein [Acidobacteriota bacterium]